MAGFRIAGGEWAIENFTCATASNISQGTAVCISNATGRQISEYSGGQNGLLGFTLAASANSLPAGQLQVAIPVNHTSTAWADVPTGLASSSLSMFECVGLYKPAGVCSVITTGYTSDASRAVQIVGACISGNSTIKVAFLTNRAQYGSISTVSIQ